MRLSVEPVSHFFVKFGNPDLLALPCPPPGLKTDDLEIEPALLLRLGRSVCEPVTEPDIEPGQEGPKSESRSEKEPSERS